MSNPFKPIPVSRAKEIAERYGYRQVIILAWDGNCLGRSTTHITTYGITMADCKMAAAGGKMIAEHLELKEK